MKSTNNLLKNYSLLGDEIKLTLQQKEVIFFSEGPLLVIAGAGTGKTMCLAHRVANLITSQKAKIDELIVLTFSEKAANEMEERLDLLLPYAFSDIQVSTFHSFGQKIIRRHALEAGIYPEFKVLKPEEMIIFLQDNLFNLPIKHLRIPSNPTLHLKAIIKLISRLKDEDISWDEYLKYANSLTPQEDDLVGQEKKEIHTEMAMTYRAVENLLHENGFLDMADLVYLPLQILRQHPLILNEYQNQFKHILVDEFQDTNHCQYQLLKILTQNKNNITVVGDDDQSIYKFRGAAISNILNFIDDFPKAKQVVLNKNFRSPQEILDSAYRLICYNNPNRLEYKYNINKRLESENQGKVVLKNIIFDNESNQAEGISNLINKKLNNGFSYKDIVILIRNNKDSEAIIRELNLKNIPFTFSGNSGLYSTPEIRMLISFLRILTKPHDSMSLYYLSSSQIYNLNPQTLTRLTAYAQRFNIELEEVFRNIETIESLKRIPKNSLNLIKKIISDIDFFRNNILKLTTGRLLYDFISKTGYLGSLAKGEGDFPEIKAKNIALFFEIIKKYEDISQYPCALPFLNHLDNLIKAGDDPPTAQEDIMPDAVSILTVHKAKGLEFPIVIISGLAEGKFPARKRGEYLNIPNELIKERQITDDFHNQEERRLFYVAMTRAKNELYLLGCKNFGGKRSRKISRFIIEAMDLNPRSIKINLKEPMDFISKFAPTKNIIKDETINEGTINSLRVTEFDDYINCPLKYKFTHILRIPVILHHRLIYGKSIREAIINFIKRKANDIPVELNDLYDIFNKEWTQEGFLSQEHEKIRFKQGKETIKKFYNNFQGTKTDKNYIDKSFSFFIDDTKIIGHWDMIKKEKDGEIILDFRSSDVASKKIANRKARDSLRNQIAILAYNEINNKLPLRLESHFVNSGIIGVVIPNISKFDNLKEKLRLTINGISKGDFLANPDNYKCNICPYNEICPVIER